MAVVIRFLPSMLPRMGVMPIPLGGIRPISRVVVIGLLKLGKTKQVALGSTNHGTVVAILVVVLVAAGRIRG